MELFDFNNVSVMPELAKAVESKKVVVTPPMKHVQEEKLSLALFHHHRLQPFWQETLRTKDLDILRSAIPHTWILDPKEIPRSLFRWSNS